MVAILEDPIDSTFFYDSQFKEFLKGFYMAPDTSLSNGAIATMLMPASISGLVLHYTDLSITEVENQDQAIGFSIRDSCSVVNHFVHDYSESTNSSIREILSTPERKLTDFAFLQGLAGLEMDINFPDLDTLADVLINKAELVLTRIHAEENLDSIYQAPLSLDYRKPFSDDFVFVDDYPIFPEPRIEIDDTSAVKTTRYIFNMNAFIQHYVDAPLDERNLRISVSNRVSWFNDKVAVLPSEYMPDRVIFAGPEHPNEEYRMRLDLFYTRLEP